MIFYLLRYVLFQGQLFRHFTSLGKGIYTGAPGQTMILPRTESEKVKFQNQFQSLSPLTLADT